MAEIKYMLALATYRQNKNLNNGNKYLFSVGTPLIVENHPIYKEYTDENLAKQAADNLNKNTISVVHPPNETLVLKVNENTITRSLKWIVLKIS